MQIQQLSTEELQTCSTFWRSSCNTCSKVSACGNVAKKKTLENHGGLVCEKKPEETAKLSAWACAFWGLVVVLLNEDAEGPRKAS